jgi:hypothetical protein
MAVFYPNRRKNKRLTVSSKSLSERERIRTFDRLLRRQMLYPAELRTLDIFKKSGRQDSNLRPPGPKPGAMTGLRYAPKGSSITNFTSFLGLQSCDSFFNKKRK